MKVSVVSAKRKYQPLEKNIARTLRGVLKKLKKDGEVEVYLVSNEEMRKLNRAARGKNKATNVLAFETPSSFPHPNTSRKPLGEVYLAPDYIEKKKENLEFLAIHGLLHLLGYDHMKKRDRIEMQKKERALWRARY